MEAKIIKTELSHSNDIYSWIGLYRTIDNLEDIKTRIGHDIEGCVIRAEMIWDFKHLLIAILKSFQQSLDDKLKTKNIHTEIAYNLNPSKNIRESYEIFGTNHVTNDDVPFFAVFVGNDISEMPNLFKQINGQLMPIDEIKTIRNVKLIEKTYKLSICDNDECAIWDLIVSKIATKDIA